jgi:hypothetical protein
VVGEREAIAPDRSLRQSAAREQDQAGWRDPAGRPSGTGRLPTRPGENHSADVCNVTESPHNLSLSLIFPVRRAILVAIATGRLTDEG